MHTELEFPPIDAAPRSDVATVDASQDLAKVDLQAVALAHFGPARAAVATAKAKLTDVVHDLSTPTKLAEAKSLRFRLIGTPLAEARKTSAALKSRLTKVSAAVGEELKSIEADFEAAEKLITPQIKAREDQLAEEARIAAEKEAARVQAHREALAKLAAPAERAALPEMTAERIANGIAAVEAIAIDRAAWEEFADLAEEQKAVTLERMRVLHVAAVAREAEAARLKAEREEAERIAAAQKAEADRLAALAADLARQQAELKAAQDRVAAEAQAKADEAARLDASTVESEQSVKDAIAQREEQQQPNSEAQGSTQVLKAEPTTADATAVGAPAIASPSVGSMGAGQAADAAPSVGFARGGYIPSGAYRVAAAPAVADLPTMTLGQISTRLGFDVRADFLASLGFEAHKEKASRLYRPSLFPAICEAISAHVLLLGSEAKKAA